METMETYSLILVALILVLVGGFVLKQRQKASDNSPEKAWPYYAKPPLTQPEQVLYFRLLKALPDHIILAQVQLSRFLGVKKGNDYQSWSNRINRMSADFVVCNKDSSVVAVIELDDSSHARANRQAADAKKDKALASAGVRIIRWQVNAIPSGEAIQSLFASTTM